MSAYQEHLREWTGCQACGLCKTRTKMVFARGYLPCDVLFVGEAPGPSEDVLGAPFVGPAGHLLDRIVEDGLRSASSTPLRVAFTNLVCCIPLDEQGGKFGEPPDDAVKACAPRLREFVQIADPKLIVCVGNSSRDWLDPKRKNRIAFHRDVPQIAIVHPAAILRANTAMQGLMIQKCVVALSNAAEELS